MAVHFIRQSNRLFINTLAPAARNFSSSIPQTAQVKPSFAPFPTKSGTDLFSNNSASATQAIEIPFDPKMYKQQGIAYVVETLANRGKHFSKEQYETLKKMIDAHLKGKS